MSRSMFLFSACLSLCNIMLANNQTVIEERPTQSHDAHVNYLKDKSSDQMPSDASMLFHIPGLTLTERGGHLGSSEIRYRGLSNSRLPVYLDGLMLNNPITGFSDANSMFLFAASRLETSAQSLSIILPELSRPFAKGLFGFGSQNSIKAGASAGSPLDDYSSLFAAMQIASTDGDFFYEDNIRRSNNDHHRLQALLKYQRKSPSGSAHTLAAINTHEGGIAGFAFSPNQDLRSRAVFAGLSAGLSKIHQKTEFSMSLSNSFFNYQTDDIPKHEEEITSTVHELTLGMKNLALPANIDFEWGQQVVVEHAYELNKTRIGGGLIMKREMRFNGRLKPKTFGNFTMLGFHQQGLIFKKDLGISIEPNDFMSLTGRFVRTQRLPTFMEMYANNRFFVGNEQLTKESVWDIELGTNLRFDQLRIQVLGFLGYLSDVIVYVPFLATKQRPINAESANRYGLDLNLNYEPWSWLMLETNNALLYSRVKATSAPLPQAPPFLGLSRIRFGYEDFINLSLQSRYRGSTSANIYGTLKTKPYFLVDSIISAQLIERLNISLSVTNIFNIKTARDIYEMPLPGTVFFGQIELGNV